MCCGIRGSELRDSEMCDSRFEGIGEEFTFSYPPEPRNAITRTPNPGPLNSYHRNSTYQILTSIIKITLKRN